jgi:hypothetical protein
MIRWIRKMLGVCEHKWTIIRETDVYEKSISLEMPNYRNIVLQCEHCGNIKVKRT